MKQNSLIKSFIIFFIALAFNTNAQDWQSEKRINILFGTTQPLFLSGFNIEGNYIHNKFIVDYSHGVSLDFTKDALTDNLMKQDVVIHMPYSTGFGVGYRFTEWLNLRVEPKWHRFEFYYNGDKQISKNEITSYNTFSLGLGLYGSFRPFKNSSSFIKGIMFAPSVRYWPTLNSSLNNNEFSYTNKNTQAVEKIKTLDPGFGFSPWIFNISIGYSFGLKKKA